MEESGESTSSVFIMAEASGDGAPLGSAEARREGVDAGEGMRSSSGMRRFALREERNAVGTCS
jgi:hypothetical protein